ncbi:MAG: porin [Paucibacter sp.]|nr:porin [Roseateles sp.]
MNKSLVALAVLGTLAGTASAQSSVTLFGVLDANVRFTKGGGNSLNEVGTDGQQTSRIGVRGVEDLGGGLKANFFLDSQIQANTGVAGDQTTTPTKFWNRRATVGLSGDFGEFRLGRDKTSVRNLIDDADAFGTVGLGGVSTVALSALGANTGLVAPAGVATNRSDNQFRYFLPSNLGGIYGSFDMGYGEGVPGNRYYGGRLGYKEGPLNLSVGMQQSNVTIPGPKFGMGAVSGSYDFGIAKLTVFGIETKYISRKQDAYGVNVQAPVGNGVVKVQYTNSNTNDIAKAAKFYNADLVSASYAYNLSKRSQLYGTISQLDNKGNGTLALNGSNALVKPTAGGKSSGFDVGITHMF